jgi:transposase-like protein
VSASDDLLSRRPRTKRVLSEDDMARMRDLYYDHDVPLPQVAAAFGVPASTLHRWIAEMDWPRRSAGWSPAPAPRADPLPAGTKRGSAAPHTGKPLNPDRLALEVAAAARLHLSALGDVTQPMSLEERRQRRHHRLAVALDRPHRQDV